MFVNHFPNSKNRQWPVSETQTNCFVFFSLDRRRNAVDTHNKYITMSLLMHNFPSHSGRPKRKKNFFCCRQIVHTAGRFGGLGQA